MNKRNFYGLFILVLPCLIAGISYACNLPPQANIDGCPKYTAVDYETYFDGFSSDPDGYIVDWRWTFPPQAYDVNYHGNPWEVTCKFSPPGIYSVILEVEDNLGATDTFECTVYAIKVYISGDGAYIPVNTDDDNENSTQDRNEFDGAVDDEDDLYQITLSIEPNNMSEGGIKLQIGALHEGTLSVWADPNKATSVINPYHPTDPTTEAEWDLTEEPFPKILFVEGYYVDNVNPYGSLIVSYLHPTMGHAVDTDGAQYNPVQVCLYMYCVTEDNEEFPGNYILYNKDDDDNDGVLDYDDGFNKDGILGNEDDDNPAEDDLVKIIPHWTEPAYCPYEPNSSITGTVTFNVSPVDTKVKVWVADPCYPMAGKLKKEQLSFYPYPPVFATPNDLPQTFYVEGIEPSDGPRDVVFKLTHNGLGFVDTVKVTVIHVELFIDANYTIPLDDWPKDPNHLRSPKYLFGKTNPIYIQVKNIGKDPDIVEDFNETVVAISQSSGYIYTDLKETGADTQIFRNSIAYRGELLYPSTEDVDDYPTTRVPDRIKVMNEEVLYFYLSIPPGNTSNYKWSEHVMVDRAEVGTEWQERYKDNCKCNPPLWDINTDWFGHFLFEYIGGAPGLVWFKDPNFKNADIDSKWEYWHKDTDSTHADAVDLTSWSGHCGSTLRSMHFFNGSCNSFLIRNTQLGDSDADWVIFDTCYSLYTSDPNDCNALKNDLLSSDPGGRCAHMFLGFASIAAWGYQYCGLTFVDSLKETTIQQAWFDYCEETQYKGSKVIVFRPVGPLDDYSNESLIGPGPIQILRDPIASYDWKIKSHEKLTGEDPPE